MIEAAKRAVAPVKGLGRRRISRFCEEFTCYYPPERIKVKGGGHQMRAFPAFQPIALFALLLFATGSSSAQSYGASFENPVSPVKGPISGFVRGGDGESPFIVRLQTITGSLVASTQTTASGRFEFDTVACGSYMLALDVAGYKPVRVPVEHSYEPFIVFLQLVPEEGTLSSGAASRQPSMLPEEAENEYRKGLEALAKQEPDRAVGHFSKAIETWPRYGEAYLRLAQVHFQLGSLAQAQQVLENALQVDGKNARAYSFLGTLFRIQNRLPESTQALKRALELNEASWMAHLEMGNTLLAQGKVDKAHTHISRAHQLNPNDPSTHVALYNVLVLQNEFEEALKELDEFLGLFPHHAQASQARMHRGVLQEKARDKGHPVPTY